MGVLLTGGAGFIGSHLAEALLRKGHELFIVDSLDNFYNPAVKRVNLDAIRKTGSYESFDIDIRDLNGLNVIFDRIRPDVVIHLAARAGVRPSLENPHLYEEVNIAGTINLLELCRKYKTRRFIFGSSSSVYGADDRVPFSEANSNLHPLSPYAATK